MISGHMDGAELRREQRDNPRHLRCDGKADQDDFHEAIEAGPAGPFMAVRSEDWDRIFGPRQDAARAALEGER